MAAVVLCTGATLCLSAPAASIAAECANEAVRVEQGAAALALPECRAYELVNEPGDAPTVSESTTTPKTQAAASGGGVAFHSWYSPASEPSDAHDFLTTRDQEGWHTSALDPVLGPDKFGYIEPATTWLSADLGVAVISIKPSGNVPEPPLVPDEPTEGEYLLERVNDPLSYQLVNVTPEDVQDGTAIFQGGSEDLSHVLFSEDEPLTPEAPAGGSLYEWREGALRLVTYLPEGEPAQGTIADQVTGAGGEFDAVSPTFAHAISADGERVVFEAGGALYMRLNAATEPSAIAPGSTKVNGEQCLEAAKACTVQLDASHVSGASGGGELWDASSDGSRVFFTDTSELTGEANTATEKPDLYEYDLQDGELSDLTADASEPGDAQGVAGVSADGSYVYFVAEATLTSTPNVRKELPIKRKRNLYLYHDGETSFIATLFPGDAEAWGGEPEGVTPSVGLRTSEVSPSGQLLAFNSTQRLTGYNNSPAKTGECSGEGCDEIFEYDAEAQALSCVSCGAPNVRPVGAAEVDPRSAGAYPRRQLMADGSVFFDTVSPLVPLDKDGTYDVYEWTPVEVAACEEGSASYSAQSHGCLYLISSGTSPEPSFFANASEDGSDLFFTTEQALLATDTSEEEALYDARVEGGLPGIPGVLVEPPACESAESCHPPASESPAEALAASAVFSGPGNLLATEPPPTETRSKTSEGKKQGNEAGKRKLKRALRLCAKKPKRKRRACQERAHRRFTHKSVAHKRVGKKGVRR
ncbi:MAG TPA: hypothetical protein VGF95_12500 [Solirubrobacteraceae bacterium]